MTAPKSPDKIKHRKLMRKSTYIILAGVLILSALTVLIVNQSPSYEDAMKSKQEVITDNLLSNLTAFKKVGDEYQALTGELMTGDELSFKVSVLRPTFVGLLISINQQKPAFAFYGRLPPGEDRRIERQGYRYIYKVASQGEAIKFCAVYAEDKAVLQKLNAKLMQVWESLPESVCLTLH